MPRTHNVRMSIMLVLALCIAALSAQAQNAKKTDLSGTWKLNIGASKTEKGAAPRAETVQIIESKTAITITLTIGEKQTSHTYVANGKEKAEPAPNGAPSASKFISRASWEGTSLVTEDTIRLSNPLLGDVEIEHSKNTWTLAPDGLVLIRATESKNFPAETLTYDKQ